MAQSWRTLFVFDFWAILQPYIALYGSFFQPTPDGNISETVGLIYLKLSQILTMDVGPNLWKFQVNETNRFRDITVRGWLKKPII